MDPITSPAVKCRAAVVAVLAFALDAIGCAPSSVFACGDDGDCEHGRTGGTCESSGFCSFPDPECHSGRRYGEHAGAGLADECVVPDPTTIASMEEPDDSTGASEPPSETSGGATTPVTTMPGDDTTSADGSSEDGVADGESTGSEGSAGAESTGDDGTSSGSPEGCELVVFDDFADGVVDEAWTITKPPGATVQENAGELELGIPADPDHNIVVTRQLADSLVGGHVRVRVTGVAGASLPAASGVVVHVGPCDLQLYVQSGVLRAHRWMDLDGNPGENQPLDNVDFIPEYPQWWQVRQDDAGTLHFEFSLDEVEWTEVAADAFDECGDVTQPPRVGVYAGGDPAVGVTRRFAEISACAPI